jgi:hypothetical protein
MLKDDITCVCSWLHLPDHNPFSSQMIYRTSPPSTQGYYVATRSHNWLESYVVVPFVSLGYLHVDSHVLGFLISCLIHRRTSQRSDTFDPYSRCGCLALSVFNHVVSECTGCMAYISRKDENEF